MECTELILYKLDDHLVCENTARRKASIKVSSNQSIPRPQNIYFSL